MNDMVSTLLALAVTGVLFGYPVFIFYTLKDALKGRKFRKKEFSEKWGGLYEVYKED